MTVDILFKRSASPIEERCPSGHKGSVSKTDRRASATWVRIPPSPPNLSSLDRPTGNPERSHSGLVRAPGKRVGLTPSWGRLPPSPPVGKQKHWLARCDGYPAHLWVPQFTTQYNNNE